MNKIYIFITVFMVFKACFSTNVDNKAELPDAISVSQNKIKPIFPYLLTIDYVLQYASTDYAAYDSTGQIIMSSSVGSETTYIHNKKHFLYLNRIKKDTISAFEENPHELVLRTRLPIKIQDMSFESMFCRKKLISSQDTVYNFVNKDFYVENVYAKDVTTTQNEQIIINKGHNLHHSYKYMLNEKGYIQKKELVSFPAIYSMYGSEAQDDILNTKMIMQSTIPDEEIYDYTFSKDIIVVQVVCTINPSKNKQIKKEAYSLLNSRCIYKYYFVDNFLSKIVLFSGTSIDQIQSIEEVLADGSSFEASFNYFTDTSSAHIDTTILFF